MQTIFIVFMTFFLGITYLQAQQTIGIVTYKVAGSASWDPESIKQGITGSEESVIYISQALVELGYQVIVFGNPPENSKHSLPNANPRYVNTDCFNTTHCDIAISWRMPSVASHFRNKATTVYLWPHDTYHWKLPESEVTGFDDVLWSTEWQRAQWISVNSGFVKYDKIYGLGINPDQFLPIEERENPYACIYSSNYARGLKILLDIWPDVKKEFPEATLDIYYGWQHWGLLSPEEETRMRAQVEQLASLGVREHGLVSHAQLNQAFARSSFWTYPCIGLETFCITGIRAQLSGAIPVIIEGSGLKETVRNGYKCSEAKNYLKALSKAMREISKIKLKDRQKMGKFILKEYTWKAVALKWKETFDTHLKANNQPISTLQVPLESDCNLITGTL